MREGQAHGIIFRFFLGVEADIFQHQHVARLHTGDGGFHFRAEAIIHFLHRFAEQFAESFGDHIQAQPLHHLPIRTAQVGHQDDFGAFAEQVLDGGQRGANARVVGDHRFSRAWPAVSA